MGLPDLGRVDPDHVAGVHVNAASVGFIPLGPVSGDDLAQSNVITHWTDYADGGHFAALETPDLLVDDIRAFLRPLR